MLNRAFFSLQSPWIPTYVACGNLALNAGLAAGLYRLGIWGIPLATSLVNIVGSAALLLLLRRRLGRVNGGELLSSGLRILVASAIAAGVAYGVWWPLDQALGRSAGAQIVSVGLAVLASCAAYLVSARLLGIRELGALLSLIGRSGRRSGGSAS
jgi:putative peptidoglycan lipid II flippase